MDNLADDATRDMVPAVGNAAATDDDGVTLPGGRFVEKVVSDVG